jgi:hypothetical protein
MVNSTCTGNFRSWDPMITTPPGSWPIRTRHVLLTICITNKFTIVSIPYVFHILANVFRLPCPGHCWLFCCIYAFSFVILLFFVFGFMSDCTFMLRRSICFSFLRLLIWTLTVYLSLQTLFDSCCFLMGFRYICLNLCSFCFRNCFMG